ncbi:MAG: arsenate reductase ArsC [Halobacteria archaeon]
MRHVLFVCVENSFRSQVAEAYFNRYAPVGWKAISAGTRPAENVHPMAVELMKEDGLDISKQKTKPLNRELQDLAEIAVIVCSGSSCPVIHSRKVLKWDIPDPSSMSIDEARKIRDELKIRLLQLINHLNKNQSP